MTEALPGDAATGAATRSLHHRQRRRKQRHNSLRKTPIAPRSPSLVVVSANACVFVLFFLSLSSVPMTVQSFSSSPIRHVVRSPKTAVTTTTPGVTAASRRRIKLSASDGAEEEEPHEHRHHKQLNIAFVTGNAMKASEIELILREHGATCGPTPDDPSMVALRMLNVDLPEIQEINTEAIAKNKAIQGAQLAGGPCVVEDTSLGFTALGGMPGPFIKWFQQKLRSDGLYRILHGYDDKSATATCTLAFCPYPHADPVVFTGVTHGTIVEPVEGRGFGWDSIFVPDGESEPFSCMSREKKCSLSHRGKAVRQWADWLGVNQDVLWERQEGKAMVGHKGLDFKSKFAEE